MYLPRHALPFLRQQFLEDELHSYAHILLHLFVHQVHHRGQVHDMLCATSVSPPQLDEFFLSGDLGLRERELEQLGLPVE